MLQNPQQVGHGYEDKSKEIKKATREKTDLAF